MKISKYLRYLAKDFFLACICLTVINAIFLMGSTTETIKVSLLWQIVLFALTYTFFKAALANKYELEKKAQMINFAICFTLADLPLLLWLWFFGPIQLVTINLIVSYIIMILIVKGMVYAMMYSDGKK